MYLFSSLWRNAVNLGATSAGNLAIASLARDRRSTTDGRFEPGCRERAKPSVATATAVACATRYATWGLPQSIGAQELCRLHETCSIRNDRAGITKDLSDVQLSFEILWHAHATCPCTRVVANTIASDSSNTEHRRHNPYNPRSSSPRSNSPANNTDSGFPSS